LSRRAVRRTLAVFAVILAILGVEAFWLEPDSLRVATYRLHLDEAPRPMRGLRIAVIADLHAGSPFVDEAKIAHVVALTNGAKPDLILLAGDYVITGVRGGRHMPIETIVRDLKGLHARLGVYAVLGNHDVWENGPHIAAVFKAAGIPVLDNTGRTIVSPRGALLLVGIGDAFTHHADPKQALGGIPADQRAICFTHSPDVFPLLPRTCLLTVAGHTHGGQVALPFIGRPIVPSRYGQRYAAGLIRESGRTLFVSTGIGTSIYPVRFGVPPEITVLELD
jgi:predicted MPP superfamily phosphohydrolase